MAFAERHSLAFYGRTCRCDFSDARRRSIDGYLYFDGTSFNGERISWTINAGFYATFGATERTHAHCECKSDDSRGFKYCWASPWWCTARFIANQSNFIFGCSRCGDRDFFFVFCKISKRRKTKIAKWREASSDRNGRLMACAS